MKKTAPKAPAGRIVGILLAAALGFLAGCGEGSGVDRAVTGKTVSYAPGQPSFDLECVPFVVRGKSELSVYLQIHGTSLTFVRAPSGFEAHVSWTIRLLDPQSGEVVFDHAWRDTLAAATYEATQGFRPVRIQKSFPVPQGRYFLEAMLEDRNTNKDVRRGQPVFVPEFVEGRPMLGNLVLQRLTGAGPEPVIVFHVPRTRDTLVGAASLFNVPIGAAYDYEFTLRRFLVDSSAAEPPFLFSTAAYAMEGRRFYSEAAETLITDRATVAPAAEQYDFRTILPPLRNGIYQMILRVRGKGQTGPPDSAALSRRFFAVMGPTFPRPSLLDELAEALIYLADRDAWTAIDTAHTPEEKRRAFDGFWLSSGIPPRQASALVRRYYSRIEEANRLFTTFKEGWRTDRGMVYTILGPPERVERMFDQETWYFQYPGTYAENSWRFRRVYFAPDNLSMEDFLLVRGRQYESLWQRILSKWRAAEVF